MPPRYITIALFILFVLSSLIQLDKLLDEAKKRDQELNGKAVQFDDWEYQLLATNLLHGKGYTEHFKLDYDAYNVHYPPYSLYEQETLPELLDYLARAQGGGDAEYAEFFRPPGFPMMLALNYAIFG